MPARAPEVIAPSEDTATRNTATLSLPHLRLPKLADYTPHPTLLPSAGELLGKWTLFFLGRQNSFSADQPGPTEGLLLGYAHQGQRLCLEVGRAGFPRVLSRSQGMVAHGSNGVVTQGDGELHEGTLGLGSQHGALFIHLPPFWRMPSCAARGKGPMRP